MRSLFSTILKPALSTMVILAVTGSALAGPLMPNLKAQPDAQTAENQTAGTDGTNANDPAASQGGNQAKLIDARYSGGTSSWNSGRSAGGWGASSSSRNYNYGSPRNSGSNSDSNLSNSSSPRNRSNAYTPPTNTSNTSNSGGGGGIFSFWGSSRTRQNSNPNPTTNGSNPNSSIFNQNPNATKAAGSRGSQSGILSGTNSAPPSSVSSKVQSSNNNQSSGLGRQHQSPAQNQGTLQTNNSSRQNRTPLGAPVNTKQTTSGYFWNRKTTTTQSFANGDVKNVTQSRNGATTTNHVDKNGQLLSLSKKDANGNPTFSFKRHADGRGSTTTSVASDGTKTSVSTRLTKNGKSLSTTSISHPDGSLETIHPNGMRHVEQFANVNGKRTKVSEDKYLPNGVHESSSYGEVNGRSVKLSTVKTYPNGMQVTSTREQTSYGYNVSVRTVSGGSSYVNVYHYHSYSYGGMGLFVYAPMYSPYYFSPLFTIWPTPMPYPIAAWGWGSWYTGYYSSWFTPYPMYAEPSFWLTDYLIASMLQSRYQDSIQVSQQAQQQQNQQIADLQNQIQQLSADNTSDQQQLQQLQQQLAQLQPQQNSATPPPPTNNLDAATKTQINTQVADAVKAYQNKQPLTIDQLINQVDPKLDHIFSVHDDIDAVPQNTDSTDSTTAPKCSLGKGDLIRITKVPADGDTFVLAKVVTTASDESCDAGTIVAVDIGVMQDMLNDFAQRVEAGLKKMSTDPHLQSVVPPNPPQQN